LEKRKQKAVSNAAALAARRFRRTDLAGFIIYYLDAVPRITVGLAVVGIAASRVQGIGIRELEWFT
jgi:hypothetical protein